MIFSKEIKNYSTSRKLIKNTKNNNTRNSEEKKPPNPFSPQFDGEVFCL